jgi:hypothetical protein
MKPVPLPFSTDKQAIQLVCLQACQSASLLPKTTASPNTLGCIFTNFYYFYKGNQHYCHEKKIKIQFI